jgi:hypothetical protein
MTAARIDWEIEQGADAALPLAWVDENGEPIPLDGYTAHLQIRDRTLNPGVLVDLTEASGIELDPLTGDITARIPAVQTAGFPADWVGEYDFFLTTPGDTYREKAAFGDVIVKRQITKD